MDRAAKLHFSYYRSDDREEWNLAGRVAGPWADELRTVWRRIRQHVPRTHAVVDLKDVTSIDESGERLSAEMQSAGAHLVAPGDARPKNRSERGLGGFGKIVQTMAAIFLCLFRFLRLFGSGHQAIALENLALRRQLAAFRRKRRRPILTEWDRLFWVGLSHVWAGWKGALVVVQPETVLRWQRDRFRRYWAGLSKSHNRPRGRPALAPEVRRLIVQMAAANPLWRAPRIHGELTMLGITVSERIVSRVLRSVPRPPSQTWRTFLKNHLSEIVSVDFFTVPTVRLKIQFVFLVLEHRRREVLHFNVTGHPTSAWVAQQITEAFGDRTTPRYMIRDRDGVFGDEARRRLETLGIHEVLTAPQSPWQNLTRSG